MGSRLRGLCACSGAKPRPLASGVGYVDLGLLWVSCHARSSPSLPTITSTASLTCGVRCRRADLQRAACATVVFHGARLFTHGVTCSATCRFADVVIFCKRG